MNDKVKTRLSDQQVTNEVSDGTRELGEAFGMLKELNDRTFASHKWDILLFESKVAYLNLIFRSKSLHSLSTINNYLLHINIQMFLGDYEYRWNIFSISDELLLLSM